MRCPTCRKVFDESNSLTLPFCSARCRQIDTNRWLSEEQRVPVRALEEESPDDERRPSAHDYEDDDASEDGYDPADDVESPDELAEEEGQASHQEEDSPGE